MDACRAEPIQRLQALTQLSVNDAESFKRRVAGGSVAVRCGWQ